MEKQSFAAYYGGEESVDDATLHEFSDLLQSQPRKLYSDSRRCRRQIQKVPPQIRRRMRWNQQVYDPIMVSLGPYHHGKPELRRAEEFKHFCLDWLADGDEKRKALFYSKILDEIEMIRYSYGEVTIVEKYDDKSLALMMLLDASMIIDFMHNFFNMKEGSSSPWQTFLGGGSGPLMHRDIIVMENQIPLRVLQILINLQYARDEAALFVAKFVSLNAMMDVKDLEILQETEDPPLHFLELFWRCLVKKHRHTAVLQTDRNRMSEFMMTEEMNNNIDLPYTPRSVMDLKTKGISVAPNSALFIRDIAFKPNACFGHLHLPVQYVSEITSVGFANLIAFEVLPNGCDSLDFLSYAIFLKALIQSPEDVKELQKRGVMLNKLANLEKVVELYKEIDTFGLHDHGVFKVVKRRIEDHCNSKTKTWIAELIYTRFRTPWTVVALLAAVFLVCLTFLQTLFTIRPEDGEKRLQKSEAEKNHPSKQCHNNPWSLKSGIDQLHNHVLALLLQCSSILFFKSLSTFDFSE